jgi:predicted kinase
MKIIIILIGIPGSGKSTFAKNYVAENPDFVILSSDAMRAEFGKGEEDLTVTNLVFKILKQRVEYFMQNGTPIIIDATNMDIKSRKDYIQSAKKFQYNVVAYDFQCTKEQALQRNIERGAKGGRNVPEFVLEKMISKYVAPSAVEGFDAINIVTFNNQQ